MKFPNNIILDYNSHNSNSKKYWVISFLSNDLYSISFANKFIWFENNFINNATKNNPIKFTLKFSQFSKTKDKTIKYKIKKLSSIISFYKKHNSKYTKFMFTLPKISLYSKSLNSFFDISYLKKEKIYTKLKYSRVPQYDAVSGGSAALLAGFLGYLITEKFGLELLDSGDFWFLFLYLVFFSFSLYPLCRISSSSVLSWFPLSYKWFFNFYYLLFCLFINFIKKIFFKQNNK